MGSGFIEAPFSNQKGKKREKSKKEKNRGKKKKESKKKKASRVERCSKNRAKESVNSMSFSVRFFSLLLVVLSPTLPFLPALFLLALLSCFFLLLWFVETQLGVSECKFSVLLHLGHPVE